MSGTEEGAHLRTWRAIERGDAAELSRLLDAHPELTRGLWEHPTLGEWSLLHYLVDRRDPALLAAALEKDPDLVGTGQGPHDTALRLALARGNLATARRLAGHFVDHHPSPAERFVLEEQDPGEPPGEERLLALQLACRAGQAGRIRLTLERVAEHDEEVAALLAGWGPVEDLAELLASIGHLTETFTGDGSPSSWLRETLRHADPRHVFDAPEAGSRPVRRPVAARPANTPTEQRFLEAANAGWLEELREMLERDPSLARCRSIWGMPALYHPGSHGAPTRLEVLELLIEAGVDPAGPDGHAALHGACWWGSLDVVERLLALAPSLVQGDRTYHPLLVVGAASRWNSGDPGERIPFLDALLGAGADPDATDRWGTTALGLAHEALRPRLLEAGAREVEAHPGRDEFFAAVRAGRAAEVRERAESDPHLLRLYAREDGASALLMLLRKGSRDLTEELAARKGPLDLNEAAALDDRPSLEREITRLQLGPARFGTPPPERPLHFLARFGGRACLAPLRAHGYSTAAPNEPDVAGDFVGFPGMRGVTPYEVALANGHDALVGLLHEELDEFRLPSA